ncbi:UxaA family hydrolase [Coralloluteibacterium stylophorae]|uniref:Altronate dehydratase n=1 Tax=Coralloluteibacterium stylophorae TaxID=1776034 RepID=A0A8J7VQN4_9GAMM|nr:altronate dehydratase family protein [Coralloluteibacterium stylophorae]MBS7458165.1 altronate dehydratase [Coralloluteibacterium stylophorae]
MSSTADSATASASGTAPRALQVASRDEVAVAVVDLQAGERIEVGGGAVTLADGIPRGHKFALRAIAAGAPVHKYGFPIGTATAAIEPGRHVHSHNLATALSGELDYTWAPAPASVSAAAAAQAAAEPGFDGYRRADGRVGTRNEVWVLCTVGCVSRIAQRVAEAASREFAGRIDGVVPIVHPFGCSQLGDDLDRTGRMLAALARHPNAGGVLLIGLGCESLQLKRLIESLGPMDPARIRSFNAQQSADEIADGLQAVAELVETLQHDRRERCPLSDLVLGLKCGGSDAFSGITANPLVGRMADRVADAGGTPVLTEIPEIFGAEHLLMERAASREVFDGMVAVVNDFKRYFLDYGQPVSENPSPGNIAGGITTLEEKSLGAVQKGGHATVTQVLRYGERTGAKGLALLEAPGNDAVSCTALTAAGATLILFTTGRGTPLGFPVPTLKLASNSKLAAAKPTWIDFDAGAVLGGRPMEAVADDLMDLVLATASGRQANNERNGEREIALWKNGVTL